LFCLFIFRQGNVMGHKPLGIVARTWRLCGELVLFFDAAKATAAEDHRASLCWALRAPESRAAGWAVDRVSVSRGFLTILDHPGPSWTILSSKFCKLRANSPTELWQRDQQNQQHTVTKPSLRICSFDVLWQSMTIYDILRISCDGSVFGFVLEELCKDLNSMDFEGSSKVGRRWTCFSYFQLLSPLDPSTFLFLWMHRNAMPNANAMLQNDPFTYSKWDVEQDCQIISN